MFFVQYLFFGLVFRRPLFIFVDPFSALITRWYHQLFFSNKYQRCQYNISILSVFNDLSDAQPQTDVMPSVHIYNQTQLKYIRLIYKSQLTILSWVHKTNLPRHIFFIAVLAPSQETERSCICVLAVMYLCVSGHVFVC